MNYQTQALTLKFPIAFDPLRIEAFVWIRKMSGTGIVTPTTVLKLNAAKSLQELFALFLRQVHRDEQR